MSLFALRGESLAKVVAQAEPKLKAASAPADSAPAISKLASVAADRSLVCVAVDGKPWFGFVDDKSDVRDAVWLASRVLKSNAAAWKAPLDGTVGPIAEGAPCMSVEFTLDGINVCLSPAQKAAVIAFMKPHEEQHAEMKLKAAAERKRKAEDKAVKQAAAKKNKSDRQAAAPAAQRKPTRATPVVPQNPTS